MSLNFNHLIDFDQIKPIVNPDLWLQLDNFQFLYDDNFMLLSPPSSPTPSICSSSSSSMGTDFLTPTEEQQSQNWFEPMLTTIIPPTPKPSTLQQQQEKPYICSFCSRAFSRRHDLQRHARVHTGVKPYHCPCCQKGFARSDARRRHFISDPNCSSSPQVQKLMQKRRSLSSIKKKL